MMFVTISSKQAEEYSYMCTRLKKVVNNMCTARKIIEGIADKSFDKSYAKCMYLIASESLQCENEIRAQIDSLNCAGFKLEPSDSKYFFPSIASGNGLEFVCDYFEEVYLNTYKKLLKDKHFGKPIKSLIQNQLQLFISSLTQLRLFQELKASAN